MISKTEWEDWKNHPVTLAYYSTIKATRESHLQFLVSGGVSEESGKTQYLLGKIAAYTDTMNPELLEETND